MIQNCMLCLFPLLHFSKTQVILTIFNSIGSMHLHTFQWLTDIFSQVEGINYILISILKNKLNSFSCEGALWVQYENRNRMWLVQQLRSLCCSWVKVLKSWGAWHKHTDQLRGPAGEREPARLSPSPQPLGFICPFVQQGANTTSSLIILIFWFYI